MKHLQLFEQFLNEGLNRKNLKEVQKIGFDDAYLEDGAIVLADTGINPWNDGHEYTFYWDGESVWCDTDMSSAEYADEVTTADRFTDVIYDANNWE